jgi:hypothetical protein
VVKKIKPPPCAGIILFRFYGYYLSLSIKESAPRELEKQPH